MMRFVSTRGSEQVSLSTAISQGLAADGGLFVPTIWPATSALALTGAEPLAMVAEKFLAPFASGDRLADELPAVCAEAFNFPAPLLPLPAVSRLSVLELFHGPTAAFKDFGARFLAATLTRLRVGASRPLRMLVATSGDTGGAVAAACYRRAGIQVTVLYPRGLVSPTQQQQLTCWGENVQSLAVRGTFDDCQLLVKQAFLDSSLRAEFDLSSANSINLGRLLPQAVYYLARVLRYNSRPAGRPRLSFPAAIWATRPLVCGRDAWVRRSMKSCWRTTPIALCPTTLPRACCGYVPACRRSLLRWTWAAPAISNA